MTDQLRAMIKASSHCFKSNSCQVNEYAGHIPNNHVALRSAELQLPQSTPMRCGPPALLELQTRNDRVPSMKRTFNAIKNEALRQFA
jgi:hypothetical protein